MPCPVCGGTERAVVNVRVSKDSDLAQVVGSTWDGRNMARCDDCGVLYDHKLAGSDGGGKKQRGQPSERVNCPDCGSLNPSTSDSCSHCGAQLAESSADRWD
jgi:uncharacterized Zn finger protein